MNSAARVKAGKTSVPSVHLEIEVGGPLVWQRVF